MVRPTLLNSWNSTKKIITITAKLREMKFDTNYNIACNDTYNKLL